MTRIKDRDHHWEDGMEVSYYHLLHSALLTANQNAYQPPSVPHAQ